MCKRKCLSKNLSLVALFSLLTSSLVGQINVKHVTSELETGTKQGIFYALPHTLIRVDIEVEKTEYFAGPYAEYASKYLDLEDVITSNYDEYMITHTTMKTCAVPDPDQVYFVEVTDKLAKEEQSLLFSLSEAGLVSDLQGYLPKGLEKSFDAINYRPGASATDLFGYFAETNLFEQTDTIIRMVVVDTVTVEKTYLDRKWVEKGTEQKAIDAANKIEQIRESRYNLLTGYQEIPYPAGTMSYMDQQLQKMEKEYLSLFMGIALKKKLFYTFYVDPEQRGESNRVPVCVFSERSGVKEAGASGGETLFLEMEQTGDFSEVELVVAKKNDATGIEKGSYYRIPETMKVSFRAGDDLMIERLFPISQFGRVTFLPPNVTSVQFHPKTGAVKTLLLE